MTLVNGSQVLTHRMPGGAVQTSAADNRPPSLAASLSHMQHHALRAEDSLLGGDPDHAEAVRVLTQDAACAWPIISA